MVASFCTNGAGLFLLVTFSLLSSTTAYGQSTNDALEARCWAKFVDDRTKPPSRLSLSDVTFSNVRDGFRVYSPFIVSFAVRGMGVVPAGKPVSGTGHHHILINQKLPIDVSKAIPFNANHVHFGKGQTQTTLDLPVGKHKLRLLFANHEHVPYFVFSNELTVEVVGTRSALTDSKLLQIRPDQFDETCAAWYQNEVTKPEPPGQVAFFQNVRDGDEVREKINLRFGAEGYGVCAAEVQVEKTGHFDLEVLRGPTTVARYVLKNGETQLDLDLRPGNHQFQLTLRSSAGAALGAPSRINVQVKGRA